jgi:hypothetical protein
LEKEISTLVNRRSSIAILLKNITRENDSILASKDVEIKALRLILTQETNTKDSLNRIISTYRISKENVEIYHMLKNEKIIDPNCKSFKGFYKKLKKEYSIPEEQKFLIIVDFLCLEKFDENGRIYSIEKINFSSKIIEKQQKLLSKNSMSLLPNNNLFLENLTGVNQTYLHLIKQLADVIRKIDSINSEIKSIEEFKTNLITRFKQNKIKLEEDYKQLSKSINEIENQITIINEQKRIETQKNLNFLKYKTKKVNGIEICTTPLTVREFKNGDEIKKARTEGEWTKFNELKIPAYHFKDFDDNQANFGFIYNYYAITDNRELAPHGFHKLNLIDFNHLDNQLLFGDIKLVDCYCGDGTMGIYKSCINCNYWTETQRKYNVCSKCQNQGYFIRGSKKCSRCNGTKKVKAFSMEGREFCIFPSSSNKVELGDGNLLGVLKIGSDGKCKVESYSTRDIHVYSAPDIIYKDQGFQVLICKDRDIEYLDNFQYTKIGDIEIMNTFLNVTKFRNGDPIKYIEDPVEWELALKNNTPAYCYFNNINNGKGCIYNIHAWNDKRGLMPLNWRSITNNDLINIKNYLNYDFSLTSAQSPVKLPQGIRYKYGNFEQINYPTNFADLRDEHSEHLNFHIGKSGRDYYLDVNRIYNKLNNQSGYILCVRDASNFVKDNQSSSVKFDIESLISNSQLLIKDDKYFKAHSKSGDYMGIYNESGLKLIDNLVQTDFDDLFDENGELRIIAMDVKLSCEYLSGLGGYTEYLYTGGGDNVIYGLIIKKSPNNNSTFTCSAIIANTSRYDRNVKIIQPKTLKRLDELSFEMSDLKIAFCFSRNKCYPSDNPIDNFHVLVGKYGFSHFGIDTEWQKEVKGAHWDRDEEWAFEQVLEFMNTH